MGQELMCNAQFDGKASHGKAMLETDYVLFRGEFRIKIAFASMRSVKAQGDWLAIDSPEAMNMSQKGVNKCNLFLERRSEMKIRERFGEVVIIIAGGLVVSAGVALLAHGQGSAQKDQQDRAAIERLHALDVETTLTDKADELAKLWDQDAVRLMAGHPAEVGKAVIYADDKKWEQSKDRDHMLTYVSDIKDVQIVGDWAFEWGYAAGSFRDAVGKIVHIRGKQLRVMKRQPDGEWKFARVMGSSIHASNGFDSRSLHPGIREIPVIRLQGDDHETGFSRAYFRLVSYGICLSSRSIC